MTIARIVSGGQTGADRGGLDAALWCRLPHGGWCPKGRRAEDGVIPAKYALTETHSAEYPARTEANVVDSDATLIFTRGDLEGGSLRTADFAEKHGKPWLHIHADGTTRHEAVGAIVQWLKTKCPPDCVLNVAGQRESKAPGMRGIVKAWMIDIISNANGTLFYPIAEDAPPDDDDDDGIALPDAIEVPRAPAGDHEQEAEVEFKVYHPRTMKEAVKIVLNALSEEDKENVRATTDRDEFRVGCHFSLSLWVRNAMIHANRNRLDLYADFQRGCREGRWSGTPEPDDVAGVVVGLVWDALHGGTET